MTRKKKGNYFLSRHFFNFKGSGYFGISKKEENDLERIQKECESNEYILLYMPKHPLANKSGYVQQHRYIMELTLGRYLLPSEVVHHIDLDKTNNDINNLLLFNSQGDHIRFHNYGYPEKDIDDLIQSEAIVKTTDGSYTTSVIDGYKCICKFCGMSFFSKTKDARFCSRLCAYNARQGNELPEKSQLMDWLNAGYSKYKIMQMLEVTETTIDAYFTHYDIDYKPYKNRNKTSRELPLVKPDKLRNLKINIRNPKDLSIITTVKGMERLIDWLINNNYTSSPDTKDGRNVIRSRIYRGVYKKRATVYGFTMDSPNIISLMKRVKNEVTLPFATQEQYNKWVEQFYLIHHCKEIKMDVEKESEEQ